MPQHHTMPLRLWVLLPLMPLLFGCVSTQGEDVAFHIKSQGGLAVSSSRVVEGACPAPPLPLESLIREAIRNNRELLARRHESRIHAGKSHYERHEWFPKFESYASYDTQPDPQRTSTKQPASTDRVWRRAYGMRMEQTLWDFGVTRGKVHSESFTAEAYAQKAAMRAVEIAYEVSECYWRVVFFQHVIALREAALDARKRERESLRARLQTRNAMEAEVLFADMQVAQAEKDLLQAQNGLHLAKRQLLFYLGRKPEDTVTVADILWVPPDASHPHPSDAVSPTHPNLLRVQAAKQAGEAAERAAIGAHFPKILLRAHIEESRSKPSSTTSGGGSTEAAGGNLAPDGYLWGASLNLMLPLGAPWVGATGRRIEAQANQAMLQAERQVLEDSIRLKLLDAKYQLEEAWKEQDVADKRRAAAGARLEHARHLHEARNATHADMAQAEEEAAQAEIGYWRALYEIRVAEAAILREAGIIPGE